jgi:hypothetical protein
VRGLDRDRVVLDGEGLLPDGIRVTAPGVSVENLTVRGYAFNGVLVTGMTDSTGTGLGRGSTGYKPVDPRRYPPLDGFAVRYVTAADNGLYGIYAFDSRNGVIEDSYASGGADSGFYVGQCKPCGITVHRNVAERNAVGFENANASGDLRVVGNRFTRNRVGLTVNSDYQEALVPQHGSLVAGNLIADNAEPGSPIQAEGGFGVGIGIGGGQANVVTRNRIEGNPAAGVIVASHEDIPPDANRIAGNAAHRNGVDLVYAASTRAPGAGTCFAAAPGTRTQPGDLLRAMGCPAPARRAGVEIPDMHPPAGLSFLEVPMPPAQPGMPAPATAPHPSATGIPVPPGWKDVPLPPRTLLADRSLPRP